ncbi:signal transduction histidine kinase [Streptomyces zagrosensis]|uniref:histidine kinase n=1 Tax=Streptomyces zagrosensis TaxID=1042984 RepID=A0A7W9V1I9_9ACTN|nr:signal transduction histidine kinase [Streptomyces zagrosensis]
MTTTGESVESGARGAPGGPWWWARRRSMVLDVLIALASVVECVFEGLDFAGEAGIPSGAGVSLGVIVGSVLVLRRRWPIAVVLVSIAASAASMGVLLTVIGLYTMAASGLPRRVTGVLSGMSITGTLIVTVVRFQRDMAKDGYHPPFWVAALVAVLMAVGITVPPTLSGLYVGARRRLVESLRERADGLERELSLLADRAEERAEWARNEERTRIAREMHDVVAHRVSLMVVHAAALQAVALKDPQKASKNAALVGDMGRQALTELRQMLGVLRSHEGQGTGRSAGAADPLPLASVAAAASAASSSASAARAGAAAPSGSSASDAATAAGRGIDASAPPRLRDEAIGGPCLEELEALIEQSRAAGMVVDLLVEGAEQTYAAMVETTAYRVVQEGLTNVHKHAPGAETRVRLARRLGEVAVLVENGPSDRAVADAGLPSGGNGLVGMRERVASLGGGFVSGPTDAGGFRVSAVLPDQAARREQAARAEREATAEQAARPDQAASSNEAARSEEAVPSEQAVRAEQDGRSDEAARFGQPAASEQAAPLPTKPVADSLKGRGPAA